MTSNKREIGQDCSLNIASSGDRGGDFDITNVSYTLDANTSESQFNDSFHQNIVFTGTSYSGSFEHDGSNKSLQKAIRKDDGTPRDPTVVSITIQESGRTVQFTNVIVNSRSKDMPADDRTSESYDFVAEEVLISDNPEQ